MERRKLMDHQKYALSMLEVNPNLGLFLEMGLGKTMICLAYAYRHLKLGDFRNGVLVMCPASLVPSWEQAIEECILFEGYDERAVKLLKENITICSYQKTYRSKRVQVGMTQDGVPKYKRVLSLRDEVDRRWSLLVVDESHQCSAHDGSQTLTAITLAKLSAHRIICTGTPTHGGKGRPDYSKLYGQIQILTAETAFKNWTAFLNKAVVAFDQWRKPCVYRESYCRRLMEDHAIVMRLEDCMDMPGMIEQTILCPLVEKKIYTDFENRDVMKYGIDLRMAGMQYNKMLQLCSGSLKVDSGHTLRLNTSKDDALADILNGTDDSVAVFCQYTASVDRAEAVAKRAGRKVVVYDGRSKRATWEDFQSGKADCIICQYQSGGTGLNLQRSHTMVFFEPAFGKAVLLAQAKARIHRTGQDHKCLYYYLVTPKTLEKKSVELWRKGVDINEVLLSRIANGEDFDELQ